MSHQIDSHAGSPAPTPQTDRFHTTPNRSPRDILRDIQNEVTDLRQAVESPSRALNLADARALSSSRSRPTRAHASPDQQHDPSNTQRLHTGHTQTGSGVLTPRTPKTRGILRDALNPSRSSQTRLRAASENRSRQPRFSTDLDRTTGQLNVPVRFTTPRCAHREYFPGSNHPDTGLQAPSPAAGNFVHPTIFGPGLQPPQQPHSAPDNRLFDAESRLGHRNRAHGEHIDGGNHPDTHQQPPPRGAKNFPISGYFGHMPGTSQDAEMPPKNRSPDTRFPVATHKGASGDHENGGHYMDTHQQPHRGGPANFPISDHFGPMLETSQHAQMTSKNNSFDPGFGPAFRSRASGEPIDGVHHSNTDQQVPSRASQNFPNLEHFGHLQGNASFQPPLEDTARHFSSGSEHVPPKGRPDDYFHDKHHQNTAQQPLHQPLQSKPTAQNGDFGDFRGDPHGRHTNTDDADSSADGSTYDTELYPYIDAMSRPLPPEQPTTAGLTYDQLTGLVRQQHQQLQQKHNLYQFHHAQDANLSPKNLKAHSKAGLAS